MASPSPQSNNSEGLSENDFNSITTSELKELLKTRNLSTKGNKTKLINRLKNATISENETQTNERANDEDKKQQRNGSIYISDSVNGTRSQSMKAKEAEWQQRLSQTDFSDDEIAESSGVGSDTKQSVHAEAEKQAEEVVEQVEEVKAEKAEAEQAEEAAIAAEAEKQAEEAAIAAEAEKQAEEAAIAAEAEKQAEEAAIAAEVAKQAEEATIAAEAEKQAEEAAIATEAEKQAEEAAIAAEAEKQAEEAAVAAEAEKQAEEAAIAAEAEKQAEEAAIEAEKQAEEATIAAEAEKQAEAATIAAEGHPTEVDNILKQLQIIQKGDEDDAIESLSRTNQSNNDDNTLDDIGGTITESEVNELIKKSESFDSIDSDMVTEYSDDDQDKTTSRSILSTNEGERSKERNFISASQKQVSFGEDDDQRKKNRSSTSSNNKSKRKEKRRKNQDVSASIVRPNHFSPTQEEEESANDSADGVFRLGDLSDEDRYEDEEELQQEYYHINNKNKQRIKKSTKKTNADLDDPVVSFGDYVRHSFVEPILTATSTFKEEFKAKIADGAHKVGMANSTTVENDESDEGNNIKKNNQQSQTGSTKSNDDDETEVKAGGLGDNISEVFHKWTNFLLCAPAHPNEDPGYLISEVSAAEIAEAYITHLRAPNAGHIPQSSESKTESEGNDNSSGKIPVQISTSAKNETAVDYVSFTKESSMSPTSSFSVENSSTSQQQNSNKPSGQRRRELALARSKQPSLSAERVTPSEVV